MPRPLRRLHLTTYLVVIALTALLVLANWPMEYVEVTGGSVGGYSGASPRSQYSDSGVRYAGFPWRFYKSAPFREMADADELWPRSNHWSFKAAARLPRLTTLRLNGCQITDEGLRQLDGLNGLQRIDLGKTRVSQQGRRAFRQKHRPVSIN